SIPLLQFKLNVQQDVTEANKLLPEAVFNVAKRDDGVKRVRLKTPPLTRRGHQPENATPSTWSL
ncbi:unnamed protein product, partial [Ectocarpus sp. 8 AP-2014]